MNNVKSQFNKQRFSQLLLVLTPIVISLLLFGFILDYYFFQDDWFNFNISTINSTKEFFNFFKFRGDIIAYRPLEIQIQYFLIRYIFGLNSFALRVINFSLLFTSYILILFLARKILKNSKMALFAGALWVTSSFHFMNLGIINYHLWGTMTWLANFLLILRFVETNKKVFYIFSTILYLISLGIWEFAISLPIIASSYFFYTKRRKFKDIVKIFLLFYLISIFYVILRHQFVARLPIIEYQIAFNLNSFKALIWYLLWSFNIPEEFKKQIADNLIIVRTEFLKDFWQIVVTAFTGAILFISLGIIYPIYTSLKAKISLDLKPIVFLLLWFGVAIFPALLLPNHNFMMYLTLPSIALYLIVSYLTFKASNKYLPYLIFFVWIVSTFITVGFYKKSMYVSSAQNVSKAFVFNMGNKYPSLPPNSVVYYHLPSLADQHALLDQNAIQAIYKNQTINIFFTSKPLIKFWQNTEKKRPVYICNC